MLGGQLGGGGGMGTLGIDSYITIDWLHLAKNNDLDSD